MIRPDRDRQKFGRRCRCFQLPTAEIRSDRYGHDDHHHHSQMTSVSAFRSGHTATTCRAASNASATACGPLMRERLDAQQFPHKDALPVAGVQPRPTGRVALPLPLGNGGDGMFSGDGHLSSVCLITSARSLPVRLAKNAFPSFSGFSANLTAILLSSSLSP